MQLFVVSVLTHKLDGLGVLMCHKQNIDCKLCVISLADNPTTAWAHLGVLGRLAPLCLLLHQHPCVCVSEARNAPCNTIRMIEARHISITRTRTYFADSTSFSGMISRALSNWRRLQYMSIARFTLPALRYTRAASTYLPSYA